MNCDINLKLSISYGWYYYVGLSVTGGRPARWVESDWVRKSLVRLHILGYAISL